MNFTREPIIETIITPKDGYKLIVRNSKGGTSEEYSVDAIEVVSFGRSFFYRSMERPKSFLLPVSDYEVIESKETRVVLKNAPLERSIKIGGGRSKSADDGKSGEKSDEKPKRRKTLRRRKPTDEKPEETASNAPNASETPETEEKPAKEEESKASEEKAKKTRPRRKSPPRDEPKKDGDPQVSSSMFRSLFPPPATLIKKEEIVIPDAPVEKDTFLSEDNMDKPDVEPTAKDTPKQEPEAKVEEETKEDKKSSEEDSAPKYHEAPTETSDEEKKEENPPKDGETPVQFKAENNFAF